MASVVNFTLLTKAASLVLLVAEMDADRAAKRFYDTLNRA